MTEKKVEKKKPRTFWLCWLIGHKAIPASWSMLPQGENPVPIQGFVHICTRCGEPLYGWPTAADG